MKKQHFTHEALLAHAVNMDLLDFLCPVMKKKEVMRVDAFRDLLNKVCKQPTGAITKEGTPLLVEPGQLVTSVSELARAWDWHRDKVRDFICALADYNVLTMDMHKKFVLLSFPDLADRIATFSARSTKDAADLSHGSPSSSESPDGGGSHQSSESSDGHHVEQTSSDSSESHGHDDRRQNGYTGYSGSAGFGGYLKPGRFDSDNSSGSQRLPGSTNNNRV